MSGDVGAGEAQIAWVKRHSPVLDGFVRETLADGALDGCRIAVVVHLEAKTAFLATILAEAGADVTVAGSNPRTTRADIVAALRARGLAVVSEAGGDHGTWEKELLAAAESRPELIVDDGAELVMRMARHRPELFAHVRGASEETTTGTARLREMSALGLLHFGALTANDARCKSLFDNTFGTGQSTLQAVLRLTNMQIHGTQVAIVGFGYVGRGLAHYARAMGARTSVIETDPVRALEAHMQGHLVGPASTLLPQAAVVITATGGMRAIGEPEIPHLRDGAVLANAGHHDLEVDVPALALAAVTSFEAREDVTTYRLADKSVHVLSGGALVNIAGGAGHPVEIMDLTFSVQGLGAHYLASHDLPAGVHVLPRGIDDAIAAAKLRSVGIQLDHIRPQQYDDIRPWVGQDGA